MIICDRRRRCLGELDSITSAFVRNVEAKARQKECVLEKKSRDIRNPFASRIYCWGDSYFFTSTTLPQSRNTFEILEERGFTIVN
jgi:hypothetical protein